MTQRWHTWEQEQKAIMQCQLQDQKLQASHTAVWLIGSDTQIIAFSICMVETPVSALLSSCSCQQHM